MRSGVSRLVCNAYRVNSNLSAEARYATRNKCKCRRQLAALVRFFHQ